MKEIIDAALNIEKTTIGRKSFGQQLIKITRILLEDTNEWTNISKEVDQVAEGTWQPINIQLRNAAINAIIARTECPSAKHFTEPQYDAILAYIQNSGKSASEAISGLWNIAENQINAIDGWKVLTLRDLKKIEKG